MTWLKRLVCFAQGHNLIGVDLPEGYIWQLCRTCGAEIRAWRR